MEKRGKNMGRLGKAFLVLLAFMLMFTVVSRASASFTVAQVQVETPQSRKIIHTVTGSGMVEKLAEQPVYAAADVLVDEVLVQQGQDVKKGDVLARLDLDSIGEKIQLLLDEIKTLNLQNQAIAEEQQKRNQKQGRIKKRAREDYDNTVSKSEILLEEAEDKIEEAKEKVKESRSRAKKQAAEAYKKTLEELQEAVNAAEKAYNAAKEQEETEIRQAKRVLEDADKTPAVTYDTSIRQIEINQKQRKLDNLYLQINQKKQKLDALHQQINQKQWKQDDLYRQIRASKKEEEKKNLNEQIQKLEEEKKNLEGQIQKLEEEKKDLEEQARDMEDELSVLKLQQKEQENAASKQEEERKQAVLRAQEDYNSTVKKNAALVSEAKQQWDAAKQKLKEFLESEEEDISENESVKAAEEALKEARQQAKEQKRQQKEERRQAKRALEDSTETEADDNTLEINRIAITEKQRQLSELAEEKKYGGKITAQMDGMVTKVQIETGQKTEDTAAFLMSDTSGGMSFTTQVSKEDAVFVVAGDMVTLKTTDKNFEELSVLSVETNEDETVKVTVFVPKDTLALGEHADMELTKQSGEYSITVPVSAVHTENERNFVYVMVPEDTVLGGQYAVQRMDVTVAEKNGLYAAISESSLTAESQVITDSDQMLSAGEKVRLKEKASGSD